MKVTGTSFKNRDQRFIYEKPVRLTTEQTEFESRLTNGTVRDVSLSGVALSMDTAVVENGQFVNMHIEGLGSVKGSVTRVYEGGAAIAFDEDEEAKKRVAATLSTLNRLA